MSERKPFRVAFYAIVEVDAYDEHEAAIVAEAACNWPGTWNPPHEPVECVGEINGNTVSAKIIRTQAIMVKPHNAD